MVFKSSTKPCREDPHFKPPSNPFRVNCSFSYCQSLSGGQVGLCLRSKSHRKLADKCSTYKNFYELSGSGYFSVSRGCLVYFSRASQETTKRHSKAKSLETSLVEHGFCHCGLKSWEVRYEALEATERGTYTETFACKRICAVLIHIVLV